MKNQSFLLHYGIKGMKWGVRRSKEEIDKAYRDGILKVPILELKNGLPRLKAGYAYKTVDKIDTFGKTLQRRKYGKGGIGLIDYDVSDHGMPKTHPTGAHRHILDFNKKNPHGLPLKLTIRELQANSDIIQKGKNYFDTKRTNRKN